MIRRTIFILFLVVLLCAFSNWKQFKANARSTLQSVFGSQEPKAVPETELTPLPIAANRETDSHASIEQLLNEAQSILDDRQRVPAEDLHRQLRKWKDDGNTESRKRLQVVDLALTNARRELQNAQHEVATLEKQTADEYKNIDRSDITLSERRKRVLALEADHGRKAAALKAKVQLLEEQIARVQSMRDQFVKH